MHLQTARFRSSLASGLLCLPLLALGCAYAVLSIAEKNWLEVRSEHFVLVGDAPEEEIEKLAVELEKFHALLIEITNAKPDLSRGPATFYLFNEPHSYRQLAPRNSAGYFTQNLFGSFRVVSLKDMNARRVAYHEYVHHLLHFRSSHHYPLWYSEGLAEFLSTAYPGLRTFRVGTPPYTWVPWIEDAPSHGPWYTLESLMQVEHLGGWDRSSTHLFYMQSWVFVHYLHGGAHVGMPGRRQQLVNYIKRLNRGDGEADAFKRGFGISREALDEELWQYIISNMSCFNDESCLFDLPIVRIPMGDLEFAEETSSRDVLKQEINTRLGQLALFGLRDAKRARLLFESALLYDSSDLESRFGLALSFAVLGQYDAARVNAEVLLADHPQYARAHLVAALVGIEEIRTRREQEEHWAPPLAKTEAIRHELRETLRIDPADVVALAVLGETYTWQEGGGEPGIAALERALQLVDWDAWSALNLAKLYVANGEPERARPLLERIVQWSHHGGYGNEAHELLEEVEEQAEPKEEAQDRLESGRQATA